jgi:hypothetical protein
VLHASTSTSGSLSLQSTPPKRAGVHVRLDVTVPPPHENVHGTTTVQSLYTASTGVGATSQSSPV